MNSSARNRSCLFGLIAFLFLSALARAEDFYVAQNAVGSGNGSSAANAAALSFFNGTANWGAGAGKISAGDTVHLVGTITSQLVVQGSGSSGSPITILFEPGARLSAPYWGTGASAAIYCYGRSFITIDGNSVGIIENTDNGTSLTNKQQSWGITLENGTDITVKNLTLQNFYVRTADSNDTVGSSGVGVRCINATSISNLVIDSNTITYGKFGIMVIMDGANNVTISNNNISRCSTMCAITKADSATTSGVLVTGNSFANGNYWDFTSGDIFHGDGLHMWTGTASGAFLDVTITRNKMLTDWGVHSTGVIFMEGVYSTININNNLLGTSAEKLAEAPIDIQAVYASGTTANIYNNTLVGAGSDNRGGMALYLQGAKWNAINTKNNVFYNFYAGVVLLTTQAVSALNFDYNDYYSVGSVSLRIDPASGDQSGSSWDVATWSSYLGGSDETHSKMVDPQFVSSTDFSLKSTSPLINAGVSLGGSLLDVLGLTRSTWDIGAYAYGASGSGGSIAPSNAKVIVTIP